MIKIIDVSKHNGNIDWKKVKAAGIKAVIIRAGYGKNNIDSRFKENIKGAIAAGLPVGIYWFSYAYTVEMAKKEAEYCIAAIKPYKVTLPVYFDWEYDSMDYAKKNGVTPNKKLITAMNKAFCVKIKAAGYKPGFYFNMDYKLNFIDVSELKANGYSTWFARYTSIKQSGYDIWQYSETGKVNGISGGNVDMNYLLKESLLKKSNKEIAKEVIAGKWGNGEDRKKRLKAAGYDYNAVQKIVNELLK